MIQTRYSQGFTSKTARLIRVLDMGEVIYALPSDMVSASPKPNAITRRIHRALNNLLNSSPSNFGERLVTTLINS